MHACLQVHNGNKYVIALQGRGYKPKLDLSFTSLDMGPVLMWQPGMERKTVVLHAHNNDSGPVSLDSHFSNSEDMQVECGATVLQPGDGKDITITFTPTAAQMYKQVSCQINRIFVSQPGKHDMAVHHD